MSSDNYLWVTADNKVYDLSASENGEDQIQHVTPLHEGTSIEDAVAFCQRYLAGGAIVEYGINFEDR